MSNRYHFITEILSRLDDDVIDQNTQKRIALMARRRKRLNRRLLISIVSVAACLALVCGAVLIFPLGNGKQVPIYQGMTVSYEAPTVNLSTREAQSPALATSAELSYVARITNASAHLTQNGTMPLGASECMESIPLVSASSTSYYAMKNEDIYIHVHLSNPDAFEILSFTLNGVKYSSYMFENGSDLETLILKYNVGNVSGLQEYTIDAIKYVDGDTIKDVRMEGDQTIEVYVNLDNTAEGGFNASLSGWDLSISPKFPEGVDGFETLGIYDGDKKLADYDPATTQFQNLPAGKKLVLIGTYWLGERECTVSYAFETPKESQGLLIANGVIVGMGSCTDSVLYLNKPIDNRAFAEQKGICEVYFGSGVTSIGEEAFAHCTSLKTVTFAQGVTTLEAAAFAGCTALECIELPDSVTFLGKCMFNGCTKLSAVTIGKNVTQMEISGSGTHVYDPIEDVYKPIPLVETFMNCPALSTVTFKGTMQQWLTVTDGRMGGFEQLNAITIQCSDGELVLEPYPSDS